MAQIHWKSSLLYTLGQSPQTFPFRSNACTVHAHTYSKYMRIEKERERKRAHLHYQLLNSVMNFLNNLYKSKAIKCKLQIFAASLSISLSLRVFLLLFIHLSFSRSFFWVSFSNAGYHTITFQQRCIAPLYRMRALPTDCWAQIVCLRILCISIER